MSTAEAFLSKNNPLVALLIACSVRIVGARRGSGFFVGPGLVLTCAHVIGEKTALGKTDVQVWFRDEVDDAPVLLDIAPEIDDDLALLSVKFKDHDSVCLGERVEIGDELYAWGFPVRDADQIGDGISGNFEAATDVTPDRFLIKFKDAEINSGFSGGALLNRKTCRVLGVVTETRGEHSTLGGWAIPADFALKRFRPYLAKAQDSNQPYLSHWFDVAKIVVKKMVKASMPDFLRGFEGNLDRYAHRDAFIGREDAYAALTKLLESKVWVTLLGAGGSGKSRLAYEVAKGVQSVSRMAVWWVPLVAVQDAALVPAEIASQLSIALPKQSSGTAALIDALKKRKMLLVLDNCEHLVPVEGRPDAPEKAVFLTFLDQLITSCPNLRVLATSRVVLNVKGEQVEKLEPMQLPSDLSPDAKSISQQSEAIALFEARAKKRDRQFSVDADNVEQVVKICRAVGGLPLAIEIAAAQLSMKSESDLAHELDQILEWKGGRHTDDLRHQTVQSVVQWSYDLLPSLLQHIFLSLSVFSGGFFDAAAGALHHKDLRGELGRLRESSMLIVSRVDSRYRYHLLEPIRQFAMATLGADARNRFAARHAAWYLEIAKQGDAQVLGPDQDTWLHRFDVDHANFRQALNWSMQHDLDTALALGANLWRFWEIRSDLQEGFASLQMLIQKAGNASTGEDFRRCLSGAGLMAYRQGDAKTALRYFERALKLEQASGDNEERLLRALNDVGIAHQVLGHFQEATAAYEEAIAISEQSENDRDVGALYFNLGKLAFETEAFEKAEEALKKSEQAFREGKNDRDLAFPLFFLGLLCLFQDPPELEEAEEDFAESLQLRQKASDLRGIADCQNGLGRLATLRGENKNAKAHFKRAFEGHHQIENVRGVSETLEWLALLLLQENQLEDALTLSFAATQYRTRGGFPAPPITAKLQAALQDEARHALETAIWKKAERRVARTETDTLLRGIFS